MNKRLKRFRDMFRNTWGNWDDFGWDDDDEEEPMPQAKLTESDLTMEFSLVDNKDKFGPRLKIKFSETYAIIMNRPAIDSHIEELRKYRALLDKMADDTPKHEMDVDVIDTEGGDA